jgi:hypothetical protein
MSIDDFKKKAAAAEDDLEIDQLCVKWLKHAAKEYDDENSRTMRELLAIIERLMT